MDERRKNLDTRGGLSLWVWRDPEGTWAYAVVVDEGGLELAGGGGFPYRSAAVEFGHSALTLALGRTRVSHRRQRSP